MKKILIVLSLILVFCGCTSTKVEEPYKTISGYDAYQMINSEKILIIDVRTKEEYNSGHLENAVNIPHTTIETEIFNVTKDFNQKIIIYCRSGGRAATAAAILSNLGYKNIYTFGGLDSWNYELVK